MIASRSLHRGRLAPFLTLGLALACGPSPDAGPTDGPGWIAGDHHVHSRYSVGWDSEDDPPSPVVGGDAIYPTPMNALMALHHGLGWIVTTDHGGPNHSHVNLSLAYPELQQSREVVPGLVQFYGMEFDTPGADHSSLIIPRTEDEASRLESLERRFAREEPWPPDDARDTEAFMIEALESMRELDPEPVLIANHPSRSASDLGVYGLDHPAELRAWNDAAPRVAVGMAGAPGHQAATLEPDGTLDPDAPRGAYGRAPTLGGFDQLTARLGGFWDSMLGEGRRWWITANSDSHINWREGGADFWPGEYSKTYVMAEPTYESILASIRAGRVFVTTGDLVSELYVTAEVVGGQGNGSSHASIGQTLTVPRGADVRVAIRFLDPGGPNHGGREPTVRRVDLLGGRMTGSVADPATDTHPSATVLARFHAADWSAEDAYRAMSFLMEDVQADAYVRVRGTNTQELEPEPDPRGEDPWSDLWFYSNPIFLEVEGTR